MFDLTMSKEEKDNRLFSSPPSQYLSPGPRISLLSTLKSSPSQPDFMAGMYNPDVPSTNGKIDFFPAHTPSALSQPAQQSISQPSTWDKIKVGDIKGLASDVGIGLDHGLANTGSAKLNNSFDQMLSQSKDPGTALYGNQQLADNQQRQNYLNANPVNSLPAMIGEQIPQIPLWMAGEGAVKALGSGLGKLAPSLASTAEKVGSKIPSFVKGGLLDAATYGTVVAPTENIQQGGDLQSLIDKEKQIPTVALGGALTRGLLKGAGEGLNLGKDVANNGGSLRQALAERQLSYPELTSNPLQDVQNSFKTAPTLQDIKSSELQKNSIKFNSGTDQTPAPITPTPQLELNAKQGDLQKLFNQLPNKNKYSFTTGEQRALTDLQDGIQTAQNYIGHTDVLAGYPAGTTIPQAYADIAKNTGVDLPKLMTNWEKAQAPKANLISQNLGAGKSAGVEIPRLAPRKSLADINLDMNSQEVIDPPSSPSIQSMLAEQKTLKNWTNKDNIPTSEPAPIRPIPAEQTLADVLKSREVQPITPNETVNPAIGQPKDVQPIVPNEQAVAPIDEGNAPTETSSIDPVNAKLHDASAHPVAEHIMGKLDDIEAAARARIQANRGRLNAGLPVDTMVDYGIIGATKIARGVVKYSVWSADMVNDLGNSIKPHLKDIWQESNKQHSLMVDGTFDHALPEPQSKIIIGKEKDPFSFKNAWDKFYTGIVDAQKPIGDFSKVAGNDTSKLASNTKNVSGIVDHNFLKAMVDKNGDKVGDSLKSVVESIPKGQEKDFWTYMSQRHNIDRARIESHQEPKVDSQGFAVNDKNGNPLYNTVIDKKATPVQANYTPSMSADAVKIAEQDHPEYKAMGDGITNWIDKFMQTWGVDTGIVNKDIYTGLRKTYSSYFPTQRDFSTLEQAIPDNVSQKFADQRTPIRKATGSERDIKDPVENIMNLVNRTVRTAKYNEVGQSLLDTVRSNPEKMKQFAEVIPTKDGMFSNLGNVITVLENGKPTYLKINNKPLLDAMNGLPKTIGNIPVLSTLTNGFKGLITQKNPVFAIRNIFRDIPTAYVNGSESNPFKFGAGLIGAGKDILTNSPRLQKYQAVGGGGANFFSSNDVSKSAAELMGKKPNLKEMALHPLKTLAESKPIKAIETFNNLTETAPRLAEFNRILNKTGSVTKALASANDVTVNFSRGGNITKNVDKAVPYLNAGVQGLDRFVRSFANPKTAFSTIVKSGVAVTTPTIALYMVNKDNPNYQALDNRTKDNYYLIPKSDGTFIKLPKSRELGVLFSSLLERSLRAADGQANPFKGFANTAATNFAPANPIDSNFISPATWNIATNKDFANRAIVPQAMLMDKRSPYLQYDDKTSSIAKSIGELTTNIPGLHGGVSPKQLDYLIKSYTGVIGQLGLPLTVQGSNPTKALSTQFSADHLFSNQATTDFYDKLDQLSSAAADKNIIQKIPSKTLTPEENMRNSMNGVSTALSRGTKLVNSIQASSDPLKDDKIKEIKSQMLSLTSKAVSAKDSGSMQSVENSAKKLWNK